MAPHIRSQCRRQAISQGLTAPPQKDCISAKGKMRIAVLMFSVFTLWQEYRTILHHDTQNMQPSDIPIFFSVWATPDRKEYPGGSHVWPGCLFKQWIGPVTRPGDHSGTDNVVNSPAAAFEIKSPSHISRSHLSGLRAFREDYPDVPLHVVAQVEHPFRLDDVLVLPWKTYVQSLRRYLTGANTTE